MPDAVKMTIEVQVRFPASRPFSKENQAIVQEKTERYLAALLVSLGVPSKAKLVLEKTADIQVVKIAINGVSVRLRYETVKNFGISAAEDCLAFGEDLLRNRLLFLTPELVRYASSRADASFQKFTEKEQEQIVRLLFAQGFGLQKLEQFAPPTDSEDKTPEAWAEACVGDLEAVRLVMLAHQSQIDPDNDPYDLNRLIESAGFFVDSAFKIKGIPLPKLQGEKPSDFGEGEMAFRINDLLFPTRPVGDVQNENLKFVNFLTANGFLFFNRGSVNFLLDSIEAANPNLLALVRTRFSIDFITGILRALAAEAISVRPLVRILEILVSGGHDIYRQQPHLSEAPPLSEIIHLTATAKTPDQLDVSDWTELVRINLKNAIVNRALFHFEQQLTMHCFYLESSFTEKIVHFESLSTSEQSTLCETLYRQIGEHYVTEAGKIRPFITSASFRKKIRDLIALEFPDTPVFSLQECLPRVIAKFDKIILP